MRDAHRVVDVVKDLSQLLFVGSEHLGNSSDNMLDFIGTEAQLQLTDLRAENSIRQGGKDQKKQGQDVE